MYYILFYCIVFCFNVSVWKHVSLWQVELDELNKICVLGKGAYGRVCLVEVRTSVIMDGHDTTTCVMPGRIPCGEASAMRWKPFPRATLRPRPAMCAAFQCQDISLKYFSVSASAMADHLIQGSQRLVNGERRLDAFVARCRCLRWKLQPRWNHVHDR